MTATIIEFLEARIAEDEAVAEATSRNSWHTVECGVSLGYWANDDCECDGPARVLAECAAKRAIIGYLAALGERDLKGDPVVRGMYAILSEVVAELAGVYANDPVYRKEWAE